MQNIDEAISEAKEAIDKLADAFETIEGIVRQMPPDMRSNYLNTESLGPISAFLQRGSGYEPAFSHSMFRDVEGLIEDLESLRTDEEDEEEV